MPIPKILHQTNPTKELHVIYRSYQRDLLKRHPHWEYHLHDDIECRDAVERHFPCLLPIYDSYALNVQRADLFRFVIIYVMGGFYVDLDVDCFKALDGLCEFNGVFGQEKILTEAEAEKLGHRDRVRVANYMFGCSPGHPFLLRVLEEQVKRAQTKIRSENDILESTGPGLLTTLYHHYKERYRDVVLLVNKDRKCLVPNCRDVSCHFGHYANHHHIGSWRRQFAERTESAAPEKSGHLPAATRTKALSHIQSLLNKIPEPESFYVLKTYDHDDFDGLSALFHRTSKVGILEQDTSHLQKAKVLVSGVPMLYSEKLSASNSNVIYTTFESDRLSSFRTAFINHDYDYCIVPHAYIKKVFEDSGVSIPIKVVHQGFTRYRRVPRNITVHKEFRIGFLGIPVMRKNLQKLFQACSNLKEKIPQVRLHVHAAQLYDWMDETEFDYMRASSMVTWTDGRMSENEIGEWYNELSCYVFPSSGEGWSFTPRESLYLGVPTIISDIPVHDELVESGFYKVIPSAGREDALLDGKVCGKWNRIEVVDIENAILDVYENYGDFQEKAGEGSRWIEDKWTNEETEQRVLAFLNSI